jgi:predicted Zn-dependent protease
LKKLLNKSISLILLVVLTGCCIVNAEGRRALAFYPKGKLDQQASLNYAKYKKEGKPAKNKNHQDIVKRVAARLIVIAERDYATYCQGFNWEVQLFEAPDTLNAWCMPGGRMAVYTGILKVCENEAALAAVMGHEIAHALLEHGNERVSQGLLAQGLSIVAVTALGADEGISESEKKSLGMVVGLASTGVILSYSRSHETEADRMGLKLLAAAGYEPSEAPNLWKRMAKLSSGDRSPEFMSTHPHPETRVEALEKLQKEVAPLYKAAAQKYGLGVRFFPK